MAREFDQIVAEMPHLLLRLQEAELLSRDDLRGIPERGVYVLYEDVKPIYVGRSNRLRERLLEHSRRSSTHYKAPFAFNLAKERAARRGIDISQARNKLERDPVFKDIFAQAKNRVSQMRIRTIQIENPVMQTLFEVYAALALKTPYNDFDTH
jgi:predicted GIY-YIG superfamily endonuclease